jgi:4a-hydroxytetrahydrobiopterin dehydratase
LGKREEQKIMECELAERRCVPCRGGAPPLTAQEIAPLAAQLDGWQVVENHHLRKSYEFQGFRAALNFVNRVGDLADAEDHHPDIAFGWGRAEITIWTHKIDGLSESDFILAAKIDRL